MDRGAGLTTTAPGEEYYAIIDRVLGNPLAAKMKQADIEDNINALRLESLEPKDLGRVAKYHRAQRKLSDA